MAADADHSRASEMDKVQWLTEKCELEKEVAELRARIQAMEEAAATHEQAMAELRAQWADFQGAAETKVRYSNRLALHRTVCVLFAVCIPRIACP
jgi:predicted  nucleic acid-binding Zn-ribbon protein